MRLIDAEHLKRWIMLRWESGISVEYDDVKTNEILEQIDRELTINLEPRKKGKWVEQDAGGDGVFYECSVCKGAFTLMDGTPSDNNYNFCPNCGSYNGGEEE